MRKPETRLLCYGALQCLCSCPSLNALSRPLYAHATCERHIPQRSVQRTRLPPMRMRMPMPIQPPRLLGYAVGNANVLTLHTLHTLQHPYLRPLERPADPQVQAVDEAGGECRQEIPATRTARRQRQQKNILVGVELGRDHGAYCTALHSAMLWLRWPWCIRWCTFLRSCNPHAMCGATCVVWRVACVVWRVFS